MNEELIYLYRRKGNESWATCDADRYAELSGNHFFEVRVARHQHDYTALEAECERLMGALTQIAGEDYEAPHDADNDYISHRKSACITRMRDVARDALAASTGQGPSGGIHFNSPDQLPPVDTPLLVLFDNQAVRARRPNFVERKGADLEFILVDGRTISGRLPWTYP